MKTNRITPKIFLLLSLVAIGALVLSACSPPPTPAPTQDVALIQTQAAQTVLADITASAPQPTTALPPPPGPTPNPDIPVAVVPTPAPGEPAAFANYNTTINSGPGTNYIVYTLLLTGRIAKIVGKSEDSQWWAVSVPLAPTGSGWINASWVTASNADSVPVLPAPPVPPTTEPIPPGPDDPQATALINLYVRSGPGLNFPAYGVALAGDTGTVIGKSEDGQWWVVRINPQKVGMGYGWVPVPLTLASNVESVQTIKNPIASTAIPPSSPASGVPSATTVEYVNVRTGPGTNYPVLGVAQPGASAEVSGKSADSAWWQVKIPNQYSSSGFGWISASFVITQNTQNVPVVAAPPPPPAVPATPPPPSGTGCSLASQSPADGTQFAPGTGFSTTWVLQNTSSTKWDQSEVDIRYVAAENDIPLHQGADIYDLTATVQPGNTYNFSVSMIAPYDQGTYGEVWEVASGSKVYCQFYVYIQVPTTGSSPMPPTNTPAAPTSTPGAPTSTASGPTGTASATTNTPPPPTNTGAAPSNTPPAPSNTAPAPSNTPPAPTNTEAAPSNTPPAPSDTLAPTAAPTTAAP